MKINKLMNSRNSQIIFQFIADTLAIWVGFAIQIYFRFFSGLITITAKPDLTDYITGSIMMSLYWYVIFFITGMYRNWHLRSPFDELFAIVRTSFIGSLIILLLIVADNTASFRMMFLLYFAVMSFCFSFFRFLARRLQVFLRKKRFITIPVILLGDADTSLEFYQKAKESVSWGIDVKGIVLIEELDEEIKNEFSKHNIPETLYLGNVSDFEKIISETQIEEVVFSTKETNSEQLIELATSCVKKKIRVNIEPNLYDHFTGQSRAQSIYGIPLIEITTQLMKPWEKIVKRLFDITFSLLVIVLGAPIWIIVAIIIKLESPGNALYTQPRVGKNNEIFTIYKFRSMAQLKTKDKETQQWTAIGDPRVTRFGKFIRKTHIDEVPQFYNVLIGDMSVVGPRPEQPKFVDEFAKALPYYNRRHLVRPGITGWWQVKYKPHTLSIEEIKNRTKDDFYYIENISLRLDFEILVRTVWCVLSGHGQT